MRVLVAGATGAVGRPLVAQLLAEGHEVSALVRSEASARALRALGVAPLSCDVFDPASAERALALAAPEAFVLQLTALPAVLDIRHYGRAMAATTRLRVEATPVLLAAAARVGVQRILCQSIAFVTAPVGPPVADERAPLFLDAPGQLRPVVAGVATMERAVLAADGLVLRYGFFYGPGTYFAPGGSTATEIARRRLPLVGNGNGISSFVHVDDAAAATVLALAAGGPGVYNVCDDDPAAARDWVPHAARALGAKPPRRVPAAVARLAAGAHAVHFATTLRGSDNARAKASFGWAPARPSWRHGLVDA